MALAKLLKMLNRRVKIFSKDLSWLGTTKVVLKPKVRGIGMEQGGPGEPPRSQERISVGTGASPQEKNRIGVWRGRRG